MTGRLHATLDAVKIVHPALDKFYNSLSDEQKERLAVAPQQANNPESAPRCRTTSSEAKPGLATLHCKIQDVVKPTDAQQAEPKKLQDATRKAVATLPAACQKTTRLTPPGRPPRWRRACKR